MTEETSVASDRKLSVIEDGSAEQSLQPDDVRAERDVECGRKKRRRRGDDSLSHAFLHGCAGVDPWSQALFLEAAGTAFASNPHCAQAKRLQVPNLDDKHSRGFCKTKCYINMPFHRVLESDATQTKLYVGIDDLKDVKLSVLHWGQMKLLSSEIEFLTPYYSEKDMTVVYAGAAPGCHIPLLSAMFSSVTFELYDPSNFDIEETVRIRIHQETFTLDTAKLFAARFEGNTNKLLFISDIRTIPSQEEKELEKTDKEKFYRISQDRIKQDMTNQEQWHMIMRPCRSILKFRLSWDPGTTPYLDGKIHFSVWGPKFSHETRLITLAEPDNLNQTTYDHKKYMLQMCYFNIVTRTCMYPPHPYHEDLERVGSVGKRDLDDVDRALFTAVDHCYDCTAHLHILTRYVLKVRGNDPDKTESVDDETVAAVVQWVEYLEDQLYQSKLSRSSCE